MPRMVEQCREEVPLEVVDPGEGELPGQGERLGLAHPDEQRADQARADGGGHGVEVPARHPGPTERLADHRREELEMGAPGDLGDHPAVHGVQVHLARHHRRQHLGPTVDHRRGGVVARGLDAEHEPVDGGHAPDPSWASMSARRWA